MNTFRSSSSGSRLLAGFGTAALLGGLGLASSRPAHTAGGPIAVTVANQPLSTTPTDNPAKQGVQFRGFVNIGNNEYGGGVVTVYTVPAGKRLVIESVTATAIGSHVYNIRYKSSGGLGTRYGFGGFNVYSDGSELPTGSSYSHLYAEAGQEVFVQVFRADTNSTGYVDCNFSGYLVDIATPSGSS